MKKIFAAVLAALCSSAIFATTLSPITLLNPSGSTSGQAIVSTGASSAPAWGNVAISTLTGILPVAKGGTNASTASGTALDNITGFAGTGFMVRAGGGAYSFLSTTNGIGLGNLAQVAANTVLANSTGSTANLAAFSMPSCSTSASALDWTSGTGFTCNVAVNAATLGGATFASPPAAGYGSTTPEPVFATTISATGLISPTSTIGIKGTLTNDNANAGSVGEYVTNTTTGTALSSGVSANATSVTLTAGDWDVTAEAQYNPAGTTNITLLQTGVSSVSATLGSLGSKTLLILPFTTGQPQTTISPAVRVSVSTSATIYAVGSASFTTSTCTVDGFIRARRVR